MDPIDLESFKAATIVASKMNEADAAAALSDFDACMEANYSLPYVHYSFRREKMPS